MAAAPPRFVVGIQSSRIILAPNFPRDQDALRVVQTRVVRNGHLQFPSSREAAGRYTMYAALFRRTTCPPSGSCCFCDTHCEVITVEECYERGGEYWNLQANCDPNLCPFTPAIQTTWGKIKASYR